MAQASCWQPLFINKATFSTIHCSQSVVHVTDPRTRHVNACREWKATHKNVVMSHFSLFSVRLVYKLAMAMRWDFSGRTQHPRRWGLEKWSIVCVCVCVFVLPSAGEADESHHVTRYCCHQTLAYTTASCCVIPMYYERILIHFTLREINLSCLHSLCPFYRMYSGLNSLDLLMFILAFHTRRNLICRVSFDLLRISFPLLVFYLTQGFSCCVPFLEELRHYVIAWPAEAVSVIQFEIFYLRSS